MIIKLVKTSALLPLAEIARSQQGCQKVPPGSWRSSSRLDPKCMSGYDRNPHPSMSICARTCSIFSLVYDYGIWYMHHWYWRCSFTLVLLMFAQKWSLNLKNNRSKLISKLPRKKKCPSFPGGKVRIRNKQSYNLQWVEEILHYLVHGFISSNPLISYYFQCWIVTK